MEYSLPSELTSTPMSLVSLVGLKDNDNLFNRFALNRGPDRVPIKFNKGDELDWPQMKPKRNSYEWFIPKGILKRNWMEKHLNQLPAVVVIFCELDWNEPNFQEKQIEIASRVQTVRSTLNGRGSKLAVVLIQNESSLPASEDMTASERASSLCSACELSTRSLFVLPIQDENLQGYITRLESAFWELAQNYYHQEIRGVKSHRDYLNKTTHLYLFVRHQFKAGFLNELKKDFHVAYKHYGQAYSLLMEVRATDTNIMEVKTIAGFISYKICKLAFKLNLPRDAISQFRKHMDIFQQKVGMDVLAFEHKAWQSNQCMYFADIFVQAIENGLPAIQTQHPGLYYQQAAQYAVARRELSEELTAEVGNYPNPDPLEAKDKMEFFGQRPWRAGKVSLEAPDMELESSGIQALLHVERSNVLHSDLILGLLEKAISQFKAFNSPRSENHLKVTMAEELKSAQRYQQALEMLKPVMDQYRSEGWRTLLDAVLSLAVKCAYLTADIKEYLALALDLTSQDSTLDKEEKERIQTNLMRLFDSDGPKVPSAEPGLTSKSERQAVGEASSKWSEVLKGQGEIEVDMGEVKSCIEAKAAFRKAVVKADNHLELDLMVKNWTPLPLPLLDVTPSLSNPELKPDWSGNKEPETVQPGMTSRRTAKFLASQTDIDRASLSVEEIRTTVGMASGGLKAIIITKVKQEEKTTQELMAKDFIIVPTNAKRLDETDGKEIDLDLVDESDAKVTVYQRDPLLTMKLDSDLPVLVGEWFVIKVTLDNKEAAVAESVKVTASLTEAADPVIADTTQMTFDLPQGDKEPTSVVSPTTPVTPGVEGQTAKPEVKEIGSLKLGETREVTFYIRISITGVRGVELETEYQVQNEGNTFKSKISEVVTLETLEPFSMESSLLSLRLRPLAGTTFTDEPFMVTPQIRSLTQHPIKIVNSWLEPRMPLRLQCQTPSQLEDCVLNEDALGRECYPLLVKREDLLSPLDVQEINLGKYVVQWIREDEDGEDEEPANKGLVTTSSFDLPPVKVTLSSLFVHLDLPAFGVVRNPLNLKYLLTNRTDKVQEYSLHMEPSESFMMSGNKQLHFKILPWATFKLEYILYPLLAGEKIALPTLHLKSTRLTQFQDAGEVLQRLLPRTIVVLPKRKGGDETDSREAQAYVVGPVVKIKNLPFKRGFKQKAVKA